MLKYNLVNRKCNLDNPTGIIYYTNEMKLKKLRRVSKCILNICHGMSRVIGKLTMVYHKIKQYRMSEYL